MTWLHYDFWLFYTNVVSVNAVDWQNVITSIFPLHDIFIRARAGFPQIQLSLFRRFSLQPTHVLRVFNVLSIHGWSTVKPAGKKLWKSSVSSYTPPLAYFHPSCVLCTAIISLQMFVTFCPSAEKLRQLLCSQDSQSNALRWLWHPWNLKTLTKWEALLC